MQMLVDPVWGAEHKKSPQVTFLLPALLGQCFHTHSQPAEKKKNEHVPLVSLC